MFKACVVFFMLLLFCKGRHSQKEVLVKVAAKGHPANGGDYIFYVTTKLSTLARIHHGKIDNWTM